MHVQIPSAKPAGGNRRSLRLIVPLPPRASPRAALEAQVDFLLAVLDRIDGDPDLEDNGDLEPSIGTCYLGEVDLEEDRSDEELSGDESEPSLGAPELDEDDSQIGWAKGGHFDLEIGEARA